MINSGNISKKITKSRVPWTPPSAMNVIPPTFQNDDVREQNAVNNLRGRLDKIT